MPQPVFREGHDDRRRGACRSELGPDADPSSGPAETDGTAAGAGRSAMTGFRAQRFGAAACGVCGAACRSARADCGSARLALRPAAAERSAFG